MGFVLITRNCFVCVSNSRILRYHCCVLAPTVQSPSVHCLLLSWSNLATNAIIVGYYLNYVLLLPFMLYMSELDHIKC